MRYTPWLGMVGISLASGCIPELYSTGAARACPDPVNSWVVNEPPDALTAQGWQEGQVPPDACLVDQSGDTVSLWQFYGEVVLFDVSTMWCAPCQELALHTEETWLDHRDDGFVYITVLAQDVEGASVEVDELQEWADIFGITAPVLADNEDITAGAISNGQYPAVMVMDRNMTISHIVRTVADEEEINEAIRDAL